MALLHVCRMDSPTGKSNSSRQSDIGAVLMLVTVKRAMKPVCHVDVTVKVAAAAAARAIGAPGSARIANINAATAA
ncbi:chitinase cellulase [Mycobacteroides abscessus subsp. abscessus]|nr:chitinase cellulase [Mycobacteroides abscessus subsp. abscessus]